MTDAVTHLFRQTVVVVDLEGVVADVTGAPIPLVAGQDITEVTPDGEGLRRLLGEVVRMSVPIPIRIEIAAVVATGVAHRLGPDRVALLVDTAGAERFGELDRQIGRLNTALRERDGALRSLRETNRVLSDLTTRYQSLVDPSPNPIVLLDDELRIVAFNPAADAVCGLSEFEHGTACEAVLGGDLAEVIAEAATTGRHLTLRGVVLDHGDGGRWFDITISPIPSGGVHLVAADVSDRVAYEKRLATLATTDALTGLGNRSMLADRVRHGLRRMARSGGGIAVVAIDIDHFQLINDIHGHSAGDLMLVRLARRLESFLRGVDTVCRVGGDEFVVVITDVPDHARAEVVVQRIHERLIDGTKPGSGIAPSMSIGYAWIDDSDVTVHQAVSRAEAALAQSKRIGRNRVTRHDPALHAWPFRSEGELLGALQHALGRNEFELHYQPITDADGLPRAIEALLRWRHPELGLLMPSSFVDRLVDSGMIAPVGRWVIEEACRQLSAWHRSGAVASDIPVHVNVAPSQLLDPALPRYVEQALLAAGLEPDLLCVEVTEQALSVAPTTGHTLGRIGEMGVSVALDDFGTGTSSLTHLRHPAVLQVKIDRSFVSAIDIDARTEQITSGLIALSGELDIAVIAEGVETQRQLGWLIAHGRPHIQGFLLSEPVASADLPHRLEALTTG